MNVLVTGEAGYIGGRPAGRLDGSAGCLLCPGADHSGEGDSGGGLLLLLEAPLPVVQGAGGVSLALGERPRALPAGMPGRNSFHPRRRINHAADDARTCSSVGDGVGAAVTGRGR